MAAHKHSSSKISASKTSAMGKSQPRPVLLDSPRRLWWLASFLLGTWLVWSLLTPHDATSVFEGSAAPQNLLGLVLAVTMAVAVAKSGVHYRFGRRQWWVVGGCLIWFLAVTMLAGRDNNPRIAWNGFWQIVALVGCYFSARALVVGPQSQRAVVLILLVGSVALALHGLHQVWVQFPADRARYLADPEGELAKIPGLDAPVGSAARQRLEDRLLYSSEPYGSFALANSLAVLLSGGIVLLAGLSIGSFRRESQSQPEVARIAAWGALVAAVAVLLLCWFLTRSRVAYPALLVGGAYWLLASRVRARELQRWLPWVLGVGGLALTVGTVWLLRNDSLVLSEAPKSLSYRLEYWLATLDMLRDHWLFGIGFGNFQSYYPIYKLPMASETIADPHNWLLDIVVSLSLPLGVVVCAWLGRQLWPRGQVQAVASNALQPAAAEAVTATIDGISGQGLLWGAGLGGAICAVLLGLLSGLDLSLTALSWLPAALVVFWFKPVVWSGATNLQVTARAAAVTMLACLLVSGSWQASGIAVPLLLLLVLGDQSVPAGLQQLETDDRRSTWSQWSVGYLPLAGLSLFLIQCWRPTTTSWSLMQQAMVAASPQQQLELTREAAAADPLSSEPLRWQAQLLTLAATLASRGEFPDKAQQVLTTIDAWLAMDSVKSLNWDLAGKQALELAAKAKNLGLDHQIYLEAALDYYSQALARYPSNIGLRAQLAVTLAIAQRWPEVQRELQLAEQLDSRTPHLDKKLRRQQLWLPLLPVGAEAEFGASQPWVEAEPMTQWLRKILLEQTRK